MQDRLIFRSAAVLSVLLLGFFLAAPQQASAQENKYAAAIRQGRIYRYAHDCSAAAVHSAITDHRVYLFRQVRFSGSPLSPL